MDIAEIQSVLRTSNPFPVLGESHLKTDYTPLDLSVNNEDLNDIDVSNSDDLERFIWNHIKTHNATIAYGGYIEKRGIYNRSTHFNKLDAKTERNIHLGVDLWIDANTEIYTPLNAEIHSFNDNVGFGNYGPTLILKHTIESIHFYTLYGHLSRSSLTHKRVGDKVVKGQQIATLGTAEVNGDYPPHLHFQIILDMQDFNGDYPGVSNQLDLEVYKNNCPDAKLLLKLD